MTHDFDARLNEALAINEAGAQQQAQGEEPVDPIQTSMAVAEYAGHIVLATQKFHKVADMLKAAPTMENTRQVQHAMAELLGAVSEANEQLTPLIQYYKLTGLATK